MINTSKDQGMLSSSEGDKSQVLWIAIKLIKNATVIMLCLEIAFFMLMYCRRQEVICSSLQLGELLQNTSIFM